MRHILLATLCILSIEVMGQNEWRIVSDFKPDTSTAHFDFGEGRRMSIQADSWDQLDSLPAIAPALAEMAKNLLSLWDTIYERFKKYKVTFPTANNLKIFYIQDFETENSFFRSDSAGKISRYKACCDTVKFYYFTGDGYSPKLRRFIKPVTVTFVFREFNNPRELTTLPVDESINSLKQNLKTRPAKNKKSWGTIFDTLPSGWTMFRQFQTRKNKIYFEPDLFVALQYTRGEWVSSAAAGLQLIKGDYEGERNVFKLLWEPHFAFTRDNDGNRKFHRNDFITFRFEQHEKSVKTDLFPVTLSLGYLVRRKGDLYEKNTFKFSFPGLKYESLSIEPEFFFNDFFRNFSPSLKLNLNID